ncbi:ABC transporter substrate-binding protein [Afifella marina]|uniref:Peptide/nickel transport system substrate-binding protein n=1 Tax=Afifella marina DSM 2698 TaxID=1120955 RepID=A0A1G5MFJ1_AFIMA|nr:ABC transporter substrate-binding protein [Afifella marina]MBK1622584.1 peptide ABC transporter substrate-binding protein [Afifella marina DSM 2698]MBK1625579.1 peptide ABC transporter substrate-binding protein [Afifella marina]MBK5917402.1 peptide ABC transporter substrate-binding protein [Afifella marina]RAI23353.1 peptide ABC transporter substrate-binding protein [Afifella marina DSM 2698]SCZ23288.1 peptide/nickel transport system substrate-binding protein [Afifella marina DSM 2698]
MRVLGFLLLVVFAAVSVAPAHAQPPLIETETLGNTHDPAKLPPIEDRVPDEPLIYDDFPEGGGPGRHGGDLRTIITRSKDVRLANVWGYARLVIFDRNLTLVPDILKSVDIEGDRVFTFHLRKGHRWSDGHPFTAEDFRYYFEDIASNPQLMPTGLPSFLLVDGKGPRFEVLDPLTVRYSWDRPNPGFLQNLAKARPPFIYRPAHFLKKWHERYGDKAFIESEMARDRKRSWAAEHNLMDDMYGNEHAGMPTLQPWVIQPSSGRRFILIRNPYYHRIDRNGRQLPYIDRIVMDVADARLVAAKVHAGEADLQARGLSFSDITVLKDGEQERQYQTLFWPDARAARIALYPNLNVEDEAWRKLFRDVRFRHALSLGIDRELINRVLFFGLAEPSNNSVTPLSPLFRPPYRSAWTQYEPKSAEALLEDIGLVERRGDGIRIMPDGRPLQIIVETAGENPEIVDALELIRETWREIGVDLVIKPSERDNIRRRANAGLVQMVADAGFDNGIPTADMPPDDFAPVSFESFIWPAWGEYYAHRGAKGEPVDYKPANDLLKLYEAWQHTETLQERQMIWRQILEINAAETFSIGIVADVFQPVVRSNYLRNVPPAGIYGWDPGAQFGLHRMDAFWFDDKPRVVNAPIFGKTKSLASGD